MLVVCSGGTSKKKVVISVKTAEAVMEVPVVLEIEREVVVPVALEGLSIKL